ncbi:hypothetical protein PIB30_097978 [Stylosanthes scabra]|uniref:Uncharacterized protein n=1 Tax=Stylosanthes scabra TaxID=79078 RepID=A0ABU6ZV90_9FABA|nr:hypothetical protein [Stylosanthes scabra]
MLHLYEGFCPFSSRPSSPSKRRLQNSKVDPEESQPLLIFTTNMRMIYVNIFTGEATTAIRRATAKGGAELETHSKEVSLLIFIHYGRVEPLILSCLQRLMS